MPRGRNSELSREPYRRVELRPVTRPYVPLERQPQQSVAHGGSVPPPPLRADEPHTQRPEITTFAHDAGAVAHGLATARRIPSTHPAQEPAKDVLQLGIDEESTVNE
jgi:hypothetical protein